jgi:hypothetical protein
MAVLAFDPDGDGIDEVVRLHGGALHWSGGPTPVRGSWQRGAVSPDGSRAVVALGAGREDRDAPIVVLQLDRSSATRLWEVDGPRNQLTSLFVDETTVHWARFVDTRTVRAAVLDGDQERSRHEQTMALQQLPWGEGLAVGRLYGDAPKSPGDLHHVAADGTRTPLDSLRGVRALQRIRLPTQPAENNHSQDVLAVCDGWHYAYGAHGDARLSLRWGPALEHASTIAWLPESYSCEQVLAVPGSPHPALVVRGSAGVHLLQLGPLGWERALLTEATELDTVTVARSPDGPVVHIAGPSPATVPLRWSRDP